MAKTSIVGPVTGKWRATLVHLCPRKTSIRSSANTPQAIVAGTVNANSNEYPFRK
jgi:hypothetical protein